MKNINRAESIALQLESVAYAFEAVYLPLTRDIPDREMGERMVGCFYTMQGLIRSLNDCLEDGEG